MKWLVSEFFWPGQSPYFISLVYCEDFTMSQLLKNKYSQFSWHLRLFLDCSCSTAPWPFVPWWMPSGVTRTVQPSQVTLFVFPLAFVETRTRLYECKLSFLQKKKKTWVHRESLTLSISASQCSVQSMAMTQYRYHLLFTFFSVLLIGRLIWFALLYIIIITILLTDTFTLLYIFLIGLFSCMVIARFFFSLLCDF